ncbi:MAG: zf-HC2 domain-containing protein [FCB group bacterium]|nr:zf-HC2 domain-containing protein [FCB group bacterium]
MSCPEYKDKISLLALGELPSDEKEEVENHLQACSACRDEFESLIAVVGMYDDSAVDTLEPIDKLQLENNILRQLIEARSKVNNPFRLSGPWVALTRLAAALLIFFAGFAAQFLVGQFEGSKQAGVSGQNKTVAVAPINKALASGMRFSSQGLKAIAHGKAAVDTTP